MNCKSCGIYIDDGFFAWMETGAGAKLYKSMHKKDAKVGVRLMWQKQKCAECMHKWLLTTQGFTETVGIKF